MKQKQIQTQSPLVAAKGEGMGEGRSGRLGLADANYSN